MNLKNKFKETFNAEFRANLAEKSKVFLKNSYLLIRKTISATGQFILKLINQFLGHIQIYRLGYLVLICCLFIAATFILVFHTAKIASQTIIVAQSIEQLTEINNQHYQRVKQMLLHITLDIQANSNMQPQFFEDTPVFSGSRFNRYSPNCKYSIIIQNESPFNYKGKIRFGIGLEYFDSERQIWIARRLPYQIEKDVNLDSKVSMNIPITNELVDSGALPTNLGNNDQVRIRLSIDFIDAFKPNIKLTQRLSYS
ncbi:MAG: hypothetical protein GF353_23140 [Candidatus Lokiarchaeota archaeon]|nr:hypothetical protein [Candidatus Lokiarchaeota archaeon]